MFCCLVLDSCVETHFILKSEGPEWANNVHSGKENLIHSLFILYF